MIWNEIARNLTQNRWMNEKRTWKKRIKIQHFFRSPLRPRSYFLYSLAKFSNAAPKISCLLLGTLPGLQPLLGPPFAFREDPAVATPFAPLNRPPPSLVNDFLSLFENSVHTILRLFTRRSPGTLGYTGLRKQKNLRCSDPSHLLQEDFGF